MITDTAQAASSSSSSIGARGVRCPRSSGSCADQSRQVALLRSAAAVVNSVSELAGTVKEELKRPDRLASQRGRSPARCSTTPDTRPTARGAAARAARYTCVRDGGPIRTDRTWRRLMSVPRTIDATVLIAPYNRARLLDETLTYLAGCRYHRAVVGSSRHRQQFDRRHATDRAAESEAVPGALRYLTERQRDARARSTPASPRHAAAFSRHRR